MSQYVCVYTHIYIYNYPAKNFITITAQFHACSIYFMRHFPNGL